MVHVGVFGLFFWCGLLGLAIQSAPLMTACTFRLIDVPIDQGGGPGVTVDHVLVEQEQRMEVVSVGCLTLVLDVVDSF